MSAGCACRPHKTQLWTHRRRSWVHAGAGGYQWRCERCKTETSRFSGPLWHATFVAAGGVPACEMGCIGSAPHLAGPRCGRVPAAHAIALTAPDGYPVRFTLATIDFITVHTSHPQRAAHIRLQVRDRFRTLRPLEVTAVVLPGLVPGTVVPCSHRTRVCINGDSADAGDMPWSFRVRSAKAAGSAPFRAGVPTAAFLGISAARWAALNAAPCAWKRWARVLHGHTTKTRVGRGTTVPHFHPAAVRPQPPRTTHRAGAPVACGYCGRKHATFDAYRRECAPDALPSASK